MNPLELYNTYMMARNEIDAFYAEVYTKPLDQIGNEDHKKLQILKDKVEKARKKICDVLEYKYYQIDDKQILIIVFDSEDDPEPYIRERYEEARL